MLKFPDQFLWGAATSAYQVEGNNAHADWWPWEQVTGKEPSGEACRHYELFEKDFEIAKSLHHNTHRFSIEWSRVEPEEGQFSAREIEHYRDMITALRRRGMEPFVTLHHFTNPVWFSRLGGWEKKKNIAYFTRFCEMIVRMLADDVRFWVTINEPTIYLYHGYFSGTWPPQSRSLTRLWAAYHNLFSGHCAAYRAIHKIYRERKAPAPMVGMAQHSQAMVPCKDNAVNRFVTALRNNFSNLALLDYARRQKTMDFVGINYYSRHLVHVKPGDPGSFLWGICNEGHHPLPKNSLGWDIYPEGLTRVLLNVKKYNVPVYITENGICTQDDNQRWDFISEHLKAMHAAIDQGVDVRGYFYWSLLDNFEWHEGFAPRFGLVHVDYDTFHREIRPSARKYAKICQTGILENTK